MTVTEEADFLRQNYGVWNALNLDGGGSTTMSWVNPANGRSSDINLTSNVSGNTATDGSNDRLVGASLAIFANPVPEPATLGLLFVAAGAGTIFITSRRKTAARLANIHNSLHSQRDNTMIQVRQLAGIVLALSIVFAAAGLATAGTIQIPYFQDFSSGVADFTPGFLTTGTSTDNWTYNGSPTDTYALTLSRSSGASVYAYSSVNASPNLSTTANSSFSLSTTMEGISFGGGSSAKSAANATVGLRFLADTLNSNTNAFVVDMNIGANPGRVRAVEWNGAAPTVVDPSSTQSSQPLISNFNLAHTYELDVFGAIRRFRQPGPSGPSG